MTRNILFISAVLLFGNSAHTQTIVYNSNVVNTSIAVVPYPVTIPCPNTTCSGGGSLVGANYTLTPSDFNLPITRVTDNSTMPTTQNYNWSYSGGPYPSPFDITDTRFVIYTNGQSVLPFSWNPSTLTATKLYGASYTLTTPYPLGLSFSYTVPYVAYGVASNGSSNAAIYSYDFTSTSVAPTGVQVVDLTTCAPAMAGLGVPWAGDLFVSADDQTFAIGIGSSTGNDLAGDLYAIVWNRTNGCRLWNTGTGAVTGAWGATGTIAVSDRFWMHYLEMNRDGTWIHIEYNHCVAACYAAPGTQLWNTATLNVQQVTDVVTGCGHEITGYLVQVNECDAGSGQFQATWYRRLLSSPNSSTIINPNSIPNYTTPTWDQHPSWATDNATDTSPFCTTVYNGQFSISGTYDNEILCLAMDGSQKVYRFAHTYATFQATPSFEAKFAIGGVSHSGKWFLWTSDWNGMLGKTDGLSNTCTVGTNCRNDIFIMGLPENSGLTLTPGMKVTSGVTVK